MTSKLRLLDLFSGLGAFSLGLERTGEIESVGFCEINDFCRRILAKHWPEIPCHDNVITRDFVKGEADIITGGFPCQDVSLAGKRAGVTGSRSGLYREMVRAIRVVRPIGAVLENVAALLGGGMGRVLGDVAENGYDAEWDCVSLGDIGAPHGRDRVWITLTDPNVFKRSNRGSQGLGWWLWRKEEIEAARDANGLWQLEPPRLLGNIRRRVNNAARKGTWWACDWKEKFEAFRRMDDGTPSRLDRSRVASAIAALGNTLSPQIAEIHGHAILEALQ